MHQTPMGNQLIKNTKLTKANNMKTVTTNSTHLALIGLCKTYKNGSFLELMITVDGFYYVSC